MGAPRSTVMSLPAGLRAELLAEWQTSKNLDKLLLKVPGISRGALWRYLNRRRLLSKVPVLHITVQSNDPEFLRVINQLIEAAQAKCGEGAE